jgi:hypothetical protein
LSSTDAACRVLIPASNREGAGEHPRTDANGDLGRVRAHQFWSGMRQPISARRALRSTPARSVPVNLGPRMPNTKIMPSVNDS